MCDHRDGHLDRTLDKEAEKEMKIEDLTDREIELLKKNKCILKLCDKWMQAAFKGMPRELLRYVDHAGNTCSILSNHELHPGACYMLDPQYEPKIKYKIYDIQVNQNFYMVTFEDSQVFFLLDLMSHEGFAGIQFAGQADKEFWHMNLASIDKRGNIAFVCDDAGYHPAKPIRIRFRK